MQRNANDLPQVNPEPAAAATTTKPEAEMKDTWVQIGTMWYKGKKCGDFVQIPNPAFGLDL